MICSLEDECKERWEGDFTFAVRTLFLFVAAFTDGSLDLMERRSLTGATFFYTERINQLLSDQKDDASRRTEVVRLRSEI